MKKLILAVFVLGVILGSPTHAFGQPSPPSIPTYFPLLEDFEFPPNFYSLDDAPVAYTNIVSWGGASLALDTTNSPPAFLEYAIWDSEAGTNLDFSTGTVWFVYAPNWASADTNQEGTGPGAEAYFLAAGDAASNAPHGSFRIYTDAGGTNIYFGGITNGVVTNYVKAPISWAENSWHMVDCEYTPTNSLIYLDGTLAATGAGVSLVPGTNTWTNGMFIGSDATGHEQMRGVMWWMQDWDILFDGGYLNGMGYSWSNMLAEVTAWQIAQEGSFGGFSMSFGSFSPNQYSPGVSYPTNIGAASNFWLTVTTTNNGTNVLVTVNNTISNLTYNIWTNRTLNTNISSWGVWQTVLATNTNTLASPFVPTTNSMFFSASLVLFTGTNGLPDWWQIQYFGQLNVNPYADPDGDGLCNYSEYLLGTNPTNAYSVSTNKTDAQALFLAYTNDATTRLRLFETNGPGTTNVTLTLSNTLVGSNYQIYSKDLTTTNSAWRVETNFVSTNSATKIVIALGGRTLGFIGGDGGDPDGDGLPSGYEVLATLTDPLVADTGNTGTPDGYKDPDGDGYLNLQEYYNGTDPHVFNAPQAPGDLTVVLSNSGGSESATVSWDSSGGSATGYVIERNTGSGFVAIATNSAGITSYTDHSVPTNGMASYEVKALFPSGGSLFTTSISTLTNANYTFPMAIVNGPSNSLYLVVSAVPSNITNFLVTRTVYGTNNAPDGGIYLILNKQAFYPIDLWRWQQQPPSYYATYDGVYPNLVYFNPTVSNGTFSIPISSFTNGIAQIPVSQAPPFGTYDLSVQAVGMDGKAGPTNDCWGPYVSPMFDTYGTVPFVDGTAQMKQNLSFLMRASTDTPFSFQIGQSAAYDDLGLAGLNAPYNSYEYPTNYVYSSFYTEQGGIDQFIPFEDNCVYSNFMFSTVLDTPADTNPNYGCPNGIFTDPLYISALPYILFTQTNILTNYSPAVWPPISLFNTYAYVTGSNLAPINPDLSGTNSQWLFYANNIPDDLTSVGDTVYGGYYNNGNIYMTNGATNFYGLPVTSFQWETFTNSTYSFHMLTPSTVLPSEDIDPNIFIAVQPPVFRTIGYYFARLSQFELNAYDSYGYLIPAYFSTNTSDPMPGNAAQAAFTPTNTTPFIITPIGQQINIAGYAKQIATNANTNVFAYLGQYFTNAFQMSNGTNTTNIAGIVSEYGSFFPTLPGEIALMTKPDPDQTNRQGQCVINVIRLSLDVNHDGVMDESFTGPDNSTADQPFQFWANNDYDRFVLDSDGTNYYDDSVESTSSAADSPDTGKSAPDCEYRDGASHRVIPCERDLQDFARLWVSGVSNTLSRLPSGSTVTLSWAGNGSSPTIDLFTAADADGGIGYLTNSTIASEQIDSLYRPYIGRIGPGSNLVLNSSLFSNNWAGDHYIWCGVSAGSDQLNLTISDGSGNVLAQSSQYIQIQDIKQMYERWTVGDAPTAVPMTNVMPAEDDFSPGAPKTAFYYPDDPAYDTNDNYILYVHGWNMKIWEKDRFAEAAFKRLYWQGYQGRFGLFRWTTGYGFSSELGITGSNPLTDPHNYDNSEFRAWQSATGLFNKLADLNAHYPGHVYVMAHSMGNVVAGEALRLAGTNQILNTYVAAQGAIPAHVYDSAVTNLIDFTHASSGVPSAFRQSSYGPDTPNIYTNWLTGTSAAAARRVNFYNPNDYALSPDAWCFDQELKPDGALLWQYHYQGSTNDSFALAQTNFYKTVFNGDPPTFFNLNFIQQRYEVMAYAAEPRSRALGSTPITTMDGLVNLTTIWPTDSSGHSYADHFWHSAEFRGDCWQEWNYWHTLLRSATLGFNISN